MATKNKQAKTMVSYSDSGVDLNLGNDASRMLYNAAKETWKNRKGRLGEIVTPFDDFSGIRFVNVGKLPKDAVLCLNFDGIGTKMEIAERMNDHSTIALDLFAMVCDDAVVRGGEPALIGTVFDVRSLGGGGENHIRQMRQIAESYMLVAKKAKVAVINGELAELGSRVGGYGKFNYNWCEGLLWFARKKRLFTGRKVKAGDYCVGLREAGFRSNGLSLARKVFSSAYGDDWHLKNFKGKRLGEWVLFPSTIYCDCVSTMFGGFDNDPKLKVHAVSHVTGGGLPEKMRRALKPSGLGAAIDDPFEPGEAILHCQEKGNIADEEAYQAWNMGQGMVVVTPEPEKAIKVANQFSIEAKVIGEVTREAEITIKSRGFFARGKDLKF